LPSDDAVEESTRLLGPLLGAQALFSAGSSRHDVARVPPRAVDDLGHTGGVGVVAHHERPAGLVEIDRGHRQPAVQASREGVDAEGRTPHPTFLEDIGTP
jgi:hypothetical protein